MVSVRIVRWSAAPASPPPRCARFQPASAYSLALKQLVLALLLALCAPCAAVAGGLDWLDRLLPHWLRHEIDTQICTVGDPAAPEARQTVASLQEVVVAPQKRAWEAALGGQAAARPAIRARLAGWPHRLLIDRATLPPGDAAFLLRLARDTWRGLDAFTDRDNGLPIDNVRFVPEPTDPSAIADARVGDYTSPTNIGLHLIATVAAADLQLLPPAEATAKIERLLDTLARLETFHGFFFNYYDTTSLERTSNFVSFVDSSWLTAGLMVVRATFPALAARCTSLIAQTDYRFFYNPHSERVSHGYYVNRAQRSPFDYGMLYTEARLGILLAIGKGDLPADAWFDLVRTFPAACTWQSLTPRAARPTAVAGHRVWAGDYEWEGMRYVPSWGGSMFEALMPTLVLDEQQYAPRSLGANDRAYALVQQRYAMEHLGYPVWGLSSCATPAVDGYAEYGVKVLGARGYEAGPVASYAAALALAAVPDMAVANLRTLATRYDVYGEYGFYDAVDPRTGQVAYEYLALDQSMLFIALANHLTHGRLQQRFASDPIAQRFLPTIGEENFFE